MIYLDASALVTLLARRTYADQLREFLGSRPVAPMATSTLGFVETVRTMDRLGDYPACMRDLVSSVTEILLTEEIRDAAAHLSGALRTLDAIHVASAQALGDALDTLVTYDKRMFDVARAAGLTTAAPGLL
ncbi:type II toxin-antitoxin system VapC family toxin [Paractinoplanes lichenicola]|uniref:Ribonuclease VapC n=1 Tax=Paractinoplanes lichenicola TaxID=2802976 RepID=A0ABS1VXH3_9ACTN|nr:type II toxin-antitoxin system VapC family toxin [Actinoplanes lichenicola]MBL7259186.1 type II toxin-antitoxin system VapC family toxin [Actinoplanes lichenicola]